MLHLSSAARLASAPAAHSRTPSPLVDHLKMRSTTAFTPPASAMAPLCSSRLLRKLYMGKLIVFGGIKRDWRGGKSFRERKVN